MKAHNRGNENDITNMYAVTYLLITTRQRLPKGSRKSKSKVKGTFGKAFLLNPEKWNYDCVICVASLVSAHWIANDNMFTNKHILWIGCRLGRFRKVGAGKRQKSRLMQDYLDPWQIRPCLYLYTALQVNKRLVFYKIDRGTSFVVESLRQFIICLGLDNLFNL